MNVKQEQEHCLDLREGVFFKNEPDLVFGNHQIYKNENVDVSEELESHLSEQRQNVEIKEEIIECEEPKIEQCADFLQKIDCDLMPETNVQFCSTTIRKGLYNVSGVKETDIGGIKEENSEYVQSKVDLLTLKRNLCRKCKCPIN